MRLREPIDGKMTCLHCGAPATLLPLNALLHPGFGTWRVECGDGRVKRMPDQGGEGTRLREVDEYAAAHDPDCKKNWLLSIDGPLWSGVYQRHAQGHWVLVEQGEGFA